MAKRNRGYRFVAARMGARKVLVPSLPYDEEWFDKIAPGVVVDVSEEDTSPSSRARRFYWTLCGKICSNHDHWSDPHALSDYLKIGAGLVAYRVWPDGTVHIYPRSIADGQCKYSEFRDFLNKAIDLVVERVMPGIERGRLLKEIEAMCGINYDREFGRKAHD